MSAIRILIVDDDTIVVESCRRILEAEGMILQMAENVVAAQEILGRNGPFDLMLTDIKMPRQDGFHLIQHAREGYPNMAVLMMTGYLTPETIKKGTTGGADGFIAKPFTPEELIGAVCDTLKNRAG
ncbi:response regulator [Desulfonema ishimotonii]|uniref:Response regulator n=1 Tax=Desulfonema ishimotonii TaxID=45657 RepID=A0A401FU12_9BACT|nr:response regulator [Desulfonema ishimotonii]GBC60451.1 response regulator [Desulfonema ishimotonii]